MSELAEMLGYRNPPKTTHNMVGKQVKLYLIKNKKKKTRVKVCVLHIMPKVTRDRLITGLYPLDTWTRLIDETFPVYNIIFKALTQCVL